MKIVNGNIINMAEAGEFDIIVHGCNCFHTMGAGLAKQISNKFPHAYEVDKNTTYGDVTKLGSYSIAAPNNEHSFSIINAYTQFKPGPHAEYTAIIAFLNRFKYAYGKFKSLKVGFPEIGCGIGGLNSEIVKSLIKDILCDMDVTLVVYEQ